MSVVTLQLESRRRQECLVPSVLPLVFDRHVVVSPLHWVGFLAAGVLVPGCILVAVHFLPPRRPAELPPMEVVLSSPPVQKPVAPQPPEAPKNEPARPKPKALSPARPRTEVADPNVRARAGKVIAAVPDAPAAPTEEAGSIVTGEGETYAGGATVSSGTSEEAVEDVPQGPPTPAVDVVAVTRAYLGQIRELLAKEKRYPLAAQRLGVEGLVVVSFVIMADGRFDQIRVVSSSGSDLLDDAAIETVHNLSGKIERPRATGALALPLKTALRFELVR
ncbi:MAG: energy transducer TonB [Armatimonadetes bacterium]|nr:energy transducer TonB [Armatimonadota bacterium]